MYEYFRLQLTNGGTRPAIADLNGVITYQELIAKIDSSISITEKHGIRAGARVALHADFTGMGIAMLFALIKAKCIVVPLILSGSYYNTDKLAIAQVEYNVVVKDEIVSVEEVSCDQESNPLYLEIQKRGVPGLVLFTSGTSGKPKGAVHDLDKLLQKFTVKRASFITINFLLFDHWGGLNTLFHILSNQGMVVTLKERNPLFVCEIIQKYKVEILPVSPTFLNLMIISEAYKQYDISSLKLITYGSEPMPSSTLSRIRNALPAIEMKQTYGLIEIGVLRSVSKDSNSTWLKIGGDGFIVRIVNNMLEIKSDSAMLGYLNAKSPFTEDGYFITGDVVEVDGEYIRILGRDSELINVGGEKVYPIEVESIIRTMHNVEDVVVYGERHPLVGQIVCARVKLLEEEDVTECARRLKKQCREFLASFKVPVRIKIETSELYNERFKLNRV